MPRSKKAAQAPGDSVTTPQNAARKPEMPTVPAWVAEGDTSPEAEEAAQEAAVKRGRVAEGRLQPVVCTLEGYEGLIAKMRTNNQYEITLLFRDEWPSASVEDKCLILAWFVRGFEGWNFLDFRGNLIPAPTPDKPESYAPILSMVDLLRWLRWDGYRQALEQSLSPN